MFIYPDSPEYEPLIRRSRTKIAVVFRGLIWRKYHIDGEVIFKAVDVVPRPEPEDDTYDWQGEYECD